MWDNTRGIERSAPRWVKRGCYRHSLFSTDWYIIVTWMLAFLTFAGGILARLPVELDLMQWGKLKPRGGDNNDCGIEPGAASIPTCSSQSPPHYQRCCWCASSCRDQTLTTTQIPRVPHRRRPRPRTRPLLQPASTTALCQRLRNPYACADPQ